MLIIDKILRVSEQGVSRPFVCEDETGDVRWCKGNHTGIRAVICEWVGARIAARLELPVPEPAILKVDIGSFRNWCDKRGDSVPQLVTETNPYVFGSLNVENVKDVFYPETELSHVDPELLARIYMFDELVHNTDRTDANSNLLVNGSAYIIDHNNAFDPAFVPDVFASEHILRRFYEAGDDAVKSEFRGRIRERITAAFIDEVWSEMPSEWTDVGAELLSPEAIKSVIGGSGK